MKSEFVKPKLVGPRFDEHSIPVEVLKDWAAFEGLVAETAKWMYLDANRERRRVPRGFSDSFALHLSGVRDGSAVAILDRVHPQPDLMPNPHAEWFERARDRVLAVIAAVSEGRGIEGLLPDHLLAYFDQFGRSLRSTESIEFDCGANRRVVYDTRVRKSLVLRTASEYRTEAQLRGAISQLNAEAGTLTFKMLNGRKLSGSYAKEVMQQAVAALGNFGESFVLVECVVVRDQLDNPKAIESITRIEPLDALDVPARLETLGQLRDGWFDGEGLGPPAAGLAWLAENWTTHWPENAPLPHVYPSPLGHIVGEWSDDARSASVEIDLDARRAQLVISSNASGEIIQERTLNLEEAGDWAAFARSIRGNFMLGNNGNA